MSAEALLDTNVLIYSISSNPAEKSKCDQARALIRDLDFGISAQVLAEFYVTATQKIAKRLSENEALQFIAQLVRLPVVAIDSDLVLEAITLKQQYSISYWDAAIIAAASRLGARTIYSEDLTHNQMYGSIRVVNPFRG
jgi:predicted nucleic acid-binding protein